MNLLAALQKEARKLTKAKDSLERQLNAIGAAVKAFGSTLAADSANVSDLVKTYFLNRPTFPSCPGARCPEGKPAGAPR